MDCLVERIAAMQRRAQQRAADVRSRLALATSVLRQKGARRIWLFGSMSRGGYPHSNSDVDLAVEGLPAEDLMRTLLELEDTLGAPVDLIRLEEASDSLVHRIQLEGEEQFVSA
jgi:uncharacterized protein